MFFSGKELLHFLTQLRHEHGHFDLTKGAAWLYEHSQPFDLPFFRNAGACNLVELGQSVEMFGVWHLESGALPLDIMPYQSKSLRPMQTWFKERFGKNVNASVWDSHLHVNLRIRQEKEEVRL